MIQNSKETEDDIVKSMCHSHPGPKDPVLLPRGKWYTSVTHILLDECICIHTYFLFFYRHQTKHMRTRIIYKLFCPWLYEYFRDISIYIQIEHFRSF